MRLILGLLHLQVHFLLFRNLNGQAFGFNVIDLDHIVLDDVLESGQVSA